MSGYRVGRQADGILAVLPDLEGDHDLGSAFTRAQEMAGWVRDHPPGGPKLVGEKPTAMILGRNIGPRLPGAELIFD